MRILTSISPVLYITRRVSCARNARQRFTSLGHIVQRNRPPYNGNLWPNNSTVRAFHSEDKPTGKHPNAGSEVSQVNESWKSINDDNGVVPVALIDLNPLNSNSTKILVFPLNWPTANDNTIKNTLTSIFSQSRTVTQIEAFSNALSHIAKYRENAMMTTPHHFAENKEELVDASSSNNHQIEKYQAEPILSLMEKQGSRSLTPHQTSAWDNLFGQPQNFSEESFNVGSKFIALRSPAVEPTMADVTASHLCPGSGSKGQPLPLMLMMKSDNLKLGLEEFTFQRRLCYDPLSISSRSFCTRFADATEPKAMNKPFVLQAQDPLQFSIYKQPTKGATDNRHSCAVISIKKRHSTGPKTSTKVTLYNSPFVSELLGGHKVPMSREIYRRSLIEAQQRRAALKHKPPVKRLKNCSPESRITLILQDISEKPYRTARDCLKANEQLKPSECQDLYKNELDGLHKQHSEKSERKRQIVPKDCIPPKCTDENASTKLKQGSCTKALIGDNFFLEVPGMPMPNIKHVEPVLQVSKLAIGQGRNASTSGSAGKEPPSGSSKGGNKSRKPNPCADVDTEHSPKCNTDPCGSHKDPCKKPAKSHPCPKKDDQKKSDPCAKKQEAGKPSPCTKKVEKKKSEPCTKKADKKKTNPCAKKAEKKKSDPCAKKMEKKSDPCKKTKKPMNTACGLDKKKSSPCTKKADPKKSDPCAKKADVNKADPCAKKDSGKKMDPCARTNPDSCAKNVEIKKADPCAKKENKKPHPCADFKKNTDKKKTDPCLKKNADDPCAKQKKTDEKKVHDPCAKKQKKETSPCAKQESHEKKIFDPCAKKQAKTKDPCLKSQPTKKCFSTAASSQSQVTFKPQAKYFSTFSNHMHKILKGYNSSNLKLNNNLLSFGFMRHYSSNGKKSQKDVDQGISSKCKSLATKKPAKRQTIQSPHPKDGLRLCYPTYDSECPKKLCKDSKSTSCNKYGFLKDTDNDKRKKNRDSFTRYPHNPPQFQTTHKHVLAAQQRELHTSCDWKRKFFPKDLHFFDEAVNEHYEKDKRNDDGRGKLHQPHDLFNEALLIKEAYRVERAEADIPHLSDYDVLVSTSSLAISGSDIHMYENGSASCPPDMTIGHDAAGVVVKAGQCISQLKPGDRVALEPGIACGICEVCKRGDYNLCRKLVFNGFFLKYQAHPADLCHKIPDSLSITDGALCQTFALGCQAVSKTNITPTSNVVVMGSGPTAVASAVCAQAKGAKDVVVMCTMRKALESMRDQLNLKCIHYTEGIHYHAILDTIFHCFNAWPDVVINCAINEETMNIAAMSLQPCGVCILAQCDTECASFNALDVLMKNIKLIPSFRSANMFPTAIHLMSSGLVPVDKMVAAYFHWDNIDEAFAAAQHESNCGYKKVIVQCGDYKDESPEW